MIYKDYLKAAQRHRETCEYLMLKLKDANEYIDVHKQSKLLHNIYYLSGYVIECIISYAFFHIIDYDSTKSVYDLDKNNVYNYTFHKYFRDHSKSANELRVDEIRKRGGNLSSEIPFIGTSDIDDIVILMYSEWDASVRYSTNHLTFEFNHVNVYNFFETANIIYTKMRKL